MKTEKPNILFIFTDQMRADCLGSLSGSQLLTPHLDRLSAEGITFTRCMSNSPLCVPARASLMNGQLVREHGIWSNRKGGDENGPSHVRNIRDAGYHTSVIGKTHLWSPSAVGQPGLHVREMDQNLEAWGFEYRLEANDPMLTGPMDCHYTDYLDSKGLLEAHREYIMQWAKESYWRGDPHPWNQPPAPVPEGDDIDSYIGRKSVEWLNDYQDDRPFYLQVQFTGPHDPYDGPQKYREMYDASSLDPGIMEVPEAPYPLGMEGRIRRGPAIASATEKQRQQWRVNYYANVTLIDEWVGKILQTLERKEELDNTLIIFNSDHGEMLGDHGLWSKWNFYDQSVLVPCILRPPVSRSLKNERGWQSDALIEHIDLPVTMLDMAGAKPFDNSLGQSLLPYLEMKADEPKASQGKDAILSELFGSTTICTKEHKLTVRAEDAKPQQLFDLKKDPRELVNVLGKSQYADTIQSLISTHLDPHRDRIDMDELEEYREYVRTTGSFN